MASIQSAINSMLGTVGSAIRTTKAISLAKQALNNQQTATTSSSAKNKTSSVSPQAQAATVATRSMTNEQQSKLAQKRKFSDYLAKVPITVGKDTKKIGDLPPELQAKIGATYNKNQRRKLMDQMDKEAGHGKK